MHSFSIEECGGHRVRHSRLFTIAEDNSVRPHFAWYVEMPSETDQVTAESTDWVY